MALGKWDLEARESWLLVSGEVSEKGQGRGGGGGEVCDVAEMM
jgi:hypothetical protein